MRITRRSQGVWAYSGEPVTETRGILARPACIDGFNISLLPVGSGRVKPDSPLYFAFLSKFLYLLKYQYDVVLVDAPPLMDAMNTSIPLLELADNVIFVIKSGDEVICSTMTFAASANPIIYQGATPVFIDSEPGTWNMDCGCLEDAIRDRIRKGKKPKAIIVVHLYGQSADIDPIVNLCRQYDIVLIEDAAESLGAYYKGRHTGTFGTFGIFSFNGNKIITCSSRGMLVSNDKHLIQKAKFLSTQAKGPAPHYQHSHIGYNYWLSNLLAGIGRGQIRVLEERVQARRANFDFYKKELGNLPGIQFMPGAGYARGRVWQKQPVVDMSYH